MDLTLLAAGQPPELRRPRRRALELSAQRRRPAGDAADRHQLRPAALQPGRHRRVRVHRQPVRRDGRAARRACRSTPITKSGTNTPPGRFRLLPRRPVQRRGLHPEPRAAVLEPAAQRDASAVRSCRTACITSPTTSTSASRTTRTYTTPYPALQHRPARARAPRRRAAPGSTIQFSPQTRLTVSRRTSQRSCDPFDARWSGGSTMHPSSPSAGAEGQRTASRAGSPTCSSNRAVNEIGGQLGRGTCWTDEPDRELAATTRQASRRRSPTGRPRILLRGFTIGQAHTRSPQDLDQTAAQRARRLHATRTTRRGRHDMKLGGEFVHSDSPIFLVHQLQRHARRAGRADSGQHRAAVPGVERRLHLEPRTRWRRSRGSTRWPVGDFDVEQPVAASPRWVQDDWTMTARLTLNLGVRYDLIKGTLRRGASPFEPWLRRIGRSTRTTSSRASASPTA